MKKERSRKIKENIYGNNINYDIFINDHNDDDNGHNNNTNEGDAEADDNIPKIHRYLLPPSYYYDTNDIGV